MISIKKARRIFRSVIRSISPHFYWRHIHFIKPATFLIHSNSIISISKFCNFKINNGSLTVNSSWFKGKHRRYISEFRLDNYSTFICDGDIKLYQGASIYVGPKAKLVIKGNGFMNTNSTLHCFDYIELGDDFAIADNVSISDSNNHCLNDNEITAPIIIKNHVWIGKNAVILKGIIIGEGAVVAAGAVVTKNVPDCSLVAGVPARVIKENIHWK